MNPFDIDGEMVGGVVDDPICKSGKIGLSGLLFQNIQFQSKSKEEAKFKCLKIQGVLKQENGLKGIKGPR
jgi:hypothetical protein